MIALRGSSASARSSSLLWLACGLLLVVACSNQVTYSRIGVELPDSGSGTGGAAMPGIGGNGAGGTGGAGQGGSGTGGADAGSDVPIGTGGMIDAGGSGMGGAGTGGSGMGGAGMGGMGTGGAGMGGMGTGGASPIDNAQFNFEASAQGWVAEGGFGVAARTTALRFAGAASLGATLTYAPAAGEMTPDLAILPAAGTGPVAGNAVTFHVFVPANAAGVITFVQPYVQDAPMKFTGQYTGADVLIFGGWNTIVLQIPADAILPIFKLAVQVHTAGTVAFTGTIYVDSISW